MKPGFVTTEFLGVVVSMFVSAMVLFKLIPAEQATVFQDSLLQFLNVCVQIASLIVAGYMAIKPLITYIEGRIKIKQQLLDQQHQLNLQAQQNDTLTPKP